MKPWTAWGIMWLSVAIAVSVGIYFTKNAGCLWAFLIPGFTGLKTSTETNDKSEG